jgi:hypothetical protein
LAPAIRRSWFFPPIDEVKLDDWYDRIEHNPSLEVSRDQFHRIWGSSDIVIEMPFGILRFDPLHPSTYTQVHGYFWSHKVFANAETFKEIVSYLFKLFPLSYILVVTPESSSGLAKLLTRIGFDRARTFGTDVYWELRR